MSSSLIRKTFLFAATVFVCAALMLMLGIVQPAHAAQVGTAGLSTVTLTTQAGSTATKGWLDAYPKENKYGYSWTGKAVKPKIVVKYKWSKDGKEASQTLKVGTDYAVTYSKACILPGQKIAKVVGKGKYKGMKSDIWYYVLPHSRKISSYRVSGGKLKLSWPTYPDKTNYYVFSFATTASAAKNNVGDYACTLFEKSYANGHGKWSKGKVIKNDTLKAKWGAGHAVIDIKKYLGKSYKKSYVYLAIAAMRANEPDLQIDGYPMILSSPTVKKIKLK